MARLIDADKLIFYKPEEKTPDGPYLELDNIERAETVDAVEVVRCKDCRYCTCFANDPERPFCEKIYDYKNSLEFYCADAVKKGPIEVQLDELSKELGSIMQAIKSSRVAIAEIREEAEKCMKE